MAAARAWREAGRRVLLYRAGRSPAGRDAAASHTAALAGDYPVTRGLCTQVGVQVLDTVEDFQDQLRLAALLGARTRTGRGRVEPRHEAGHGPRPGRPPRVALLSNAGFECVSMADRATGLEVAGLSPESLSALEVLLRELGLREIVAPRNPLDLTPIAGDAGYARAAALLLDDPGVDCAVVSCVPLTPALQTLPAGDGHPEDLTRDDGLGPALIRLWEATEKPWVVAVDAGPAYEPFRRSLADAGIPVFSSADRAVRALASWAAAGG
jgi:acyl-CoA synthetase (NDP forming)